MKRKSIPKIVKDEVYSRQKGKCACCLDPGDEYHHFKAFCLGGGFITKNIVLLCKNHHNLIHLGDFPTISSIIEYIYFLHYNEMPNEITEEIFKDITESIENKQDALN